MNSTEHFLPNLLNQSFSMQHQLFVSGCGGLSTVSRTLVLLHSVIMPPHPP